MLVLFGIPTLAVPEKNYADMEGYYTPVQTIDNVIEEIKKLQEKGWNAHFLGGGDDVVAERCLPAVLRPPKLRDSAPGNAHEFLFAADGKVQGKASGGDTLYWQRLHLPEEVQRVIPECLVDALQQVFNRVKFFCHSALILKYLANGSSG